MNRTSVVLRSIVYVCLGLRQLVERKLVERQLGVVNWSQRQLVATTISRIKKMVAYTRLNNRIIY